MPVANIQQPCLVCGNLVNGEINWQCLDCNRDIFPFEQLTDEEFMNTIQSTNKQSIRERLRGVEERLLDLQELNEIHDMFNFNNVDPDINYYNILAENNLTCEYYIEETFTNMIKSKLGDSDAFSLIHLNIRSAVKNLDSFQWYMQNIELKFDVIGLTETWFNDNNADRYGILGYNQENNNRQIKRGGGVSLYIKDHIDYRVREDLGKICNYAETLFVEIDKNAIGYKRYVITGVIYRPPDSNIEEFLNYMNDIFTKLGRENKTVYLMGDYNINMINNVSHKSTAEFIETCFSYSYVPLINKPTRVTDTTATLIDNIFCNDIFDQSIINGVMCTDISDHFPVFCIVKTKKSINSKNSFIKRQVNQCNIQKFKDKLSHTDWNSIVDNKSCQDAFSGFHSVYRRYYEECFPLKKIKINYHNRKTWLTNGLKISIKRKIKLYLLSRKNPTDENKNIYLNHKRLLQKLLRQSERLHYDDLLKQHIGNIKKSWEIIREVINKKQSRKVTPNFNIQ